MVLSTLEKVGIESTNHNDTIDGLRSTFAEIPEGSTLDIKTRYKYKNIGGVGLKFKGGPYKFSINDKEFTSKVLDDKVEQFTFPKVETDRVSIKALQNMEVITAEVYTSGAAQRSAAPFTCIVVPTGTIGRRWYCTSGDGSKSWYAGTEYAYKGLLARDAVLDQTPGNLPPPAPETAPPEPPSPAPSPAPSGELDENGIKLLVPVKSGGQVWTNMSYKFSTHNTGTRDTFSKDIGDALNIAAIGYYNISLSDNSEELSNKIYGGNHTGDGVNNTTKQGRCYSIGVEQDGSPSFKKEYPAHPTTPDFSNNVTFFDPNFKTLGSIKNKDIGLAIYAIADHTNKKVDFECWVDVSGLKDGKPQNQWKPFYHISDTGSNLKGEAYLENQGIKHGGKGIYYMRIDTVTRKTKVYGQKVYEIDRLPSKNQ